MNSVSSPIKYKASPLRLIFYAIFFSLMLFLLLPLSRLFQDFTMEKEIVRTIELATTPPPPQQKQEQEQEAVVEEMIEIERVETPIEVEPLDVQLEVSLDSELEVKIETAAFNIKRDRSTILAEIKTFSLEELDETPVSLNEPLFQRPEDAGFEEINALINVWLTEEGKVEFIKFWSLENQKAAAAIITYVEKLKFTPPTKDGEVGRTKFNLPFRSRALSFRERQDQRRLEGSRSGISASGVTPP